MGGPVASTALAEIWAATSDRLSHLLQARRVNPIVAEEIIQEVALRILASDVTYSNASDLWPWASTVARRLAVDHWRATAHVEHGVTFDEVSRDNVEDIVEHRMRLDATFAAIRRLSRSDQEHLIGLLNEPTLAGPIPSRTKVAVHRARRRLIAALGQVGAVLASLRLRPKSRKMPGATVLAVGAVIPVVFLLATRSPGPLERGSPGVTEPALDISVPASIHVQDRNTLPRPAPNGPGASLARSSGSVAIRTPPATTPQTTVPIRYPAGLPPGEITVRPRRPGDHLVCVNKLPLVLQACVD